MPAPTTTQAGTRTHSPPSSTICSSLRDAVVRGTTATKGRPSSRAKQASGIAVLPDEASITGVPSRSVPLTRP